MLTYLQEILRIVLYLTLLEALYEGFHDRAKDPKKVWTVKVKEESLNISMLLSKFFQGTYLLGVLYLAKTCFEWGKAATSNWDWTILYFWIGIRVGLFNWVNMLAAGRKTPLGKTSAIDRLLHWMSGGGVWWMYGLFCLLGIAYCYFAYLGKI